MLDQSGMGVRLFLKENDKHGTETYEQERAHIIRITLVELDFENKKI